MPTATKIRLIALFNPTPTPPKPLLHNHLDFGDYYRELQAFYANSNVHSPPAYQSHSPMFLDGNRYNEQWQSYLHSNQMLSSSVQGGGFPPYAYATRSGDHMPQPAANCTWQSRMMQHENQMLRSQGKGRHFPPYATKPDHVSRKSNASMRTVAKKARSGMKVKKQFEPDKTKKRTVTKKAEQFEPTPSQNNRVYLTIRSVSAKYGDGVEKQKKLGMAKLAGITQKRAKWQAQVYFAGKSRYIGVFETREDAALAYEVAKDYLSSSSNITLAGEEMKTAHEIAIARKAAYIILSLVEEV